MSKLQNIVSALLIDAALLAIALSIAYGIVGEGEFKRVATGICVGTAIGVLNQVVWFLQYE